MKILKKVMLVLSVMTIVGSLSFSGISKHFRKKSSRKPAAKKVLTETYRCGSETITVSYPTNDSARIVDSSGRIFNLKSAVSASGARYTSKGGDIEFFAGHKNALFTGPSGAETSCRKK